MLVPTSGSRAALALGGDGDRLHLSLAQLLITASTLIYPQWNDVIRSPAEWRRERQMTKNAEAETYESLMDNGLKPKSQNRAKASVKEKDVFQLHLGHFHMCFETGYTGFKSYIFGEMKIVTGAKFLDLGQFRSNFIRNVKFNYGCGLLIMSFCLEGMWTFTRG